MTEVNAQIPLSTIVPKQPDSLDQLGKAFTLSDAMRQRQDQTALRDIMSTNDFSTVAGRQKAYPALMKVNPELGLKLQGQDREYQMSRMKQKLEFMGGQAAQVHNKYMELKASGLGEQAAVQAANDFYKRGLGALAGARNADDGSPMFSEDELRGIPQDFDPAVVGQTLAQLVGAKGMLEQGDRERAAAETKRNHVASEEKLNPKDRAFTAFMAQNPNATAEEQAAFIQKSGSQPRSANAMAVQKYLEENPSASAEDISSFAAGMKAQGGAANYWTGGGKGAQQLQSLNTAVNHIDTARELVDALHNGNTQVLNRIAQKWAKETGSSAPTNLETASQIIGSEMVKAVVAGGGGQAERQQAESAFATARSPEQLLGAIETVTELMRGQATSARQQFVTNTKLSEDDFYRRFEPRARAIIFGGKSPENNRPSLDSFKK